WILSLQLKQKLRLRLSCSWEMITSASLKLSKQRKSRSLLEGRGYIMEKTIINPPTLAPPVGFSHGVLVTGGRLLFLAGQTGSNAEGQIIAPGDLVAQYEQTLRNLQTVVESAGGKMQDITKLDIFIRDREDYLAQLQPLGIVHRSFFG